MENYLCVIMAYQAYDFDLHVVRTYDTFREVYDFCANADGGAKIMFDGMEWVWKTKGDLWESEDCLENLNVEYKNDQDLENGYWVWFADVAPNHNELVNMEFAGLITPKQRNFMYFRACVIEVVNENTFMNRFGYFNE